jgi:ribokinase
MFFKVPGFHSGGETVHAEEFHEEWGGKGFNQAVAAARQGAQTAFLGKVGSEPDSRAVCEFCEKEGATPCICHAESSVEATACAAILTDAAGETRVTVAPGAALDVRDVEKFSGRIAEADMLLLNNEVPEEVNLRASEIAETHGVRIVMNPAPSRVLPDELKRRVFLWTPNEFEESALGDVPGEVVTTLGARGCRIRSTGMVVPAVRRGETVDTTGAGDVFTASLCVRIAEGETVEDACRAANAAAAMSVTRRYVMPSIPHREDEEGRCR